MNEWPSRAVLTVPGGSPRVPKVVVRWTTTYPYELPPFIDYVLPDGQTERYYRREQ